MKKRIISAIICAGFLAALTVTQMVGGTAFVQPQSTLQTAEAEEDLVDNFEESIRVDGTLIAKPDVPMAPSSKSDTKVVTSKPKVTTKKSKGRLKKAAAKSKTVTKKTTRRQKKSSVTKKNTVLKETTTVTTKKTVYKKGSRITNITTKVSKTVKTTTTPVKVEEGNLKKIAGEADAKLLQRFEDEGYKYVVDTGLEYVGLFSSRNKQITMRYQSDVVYHELGHYLAFTTGKTDLADEWVEIYEDEADKFDGDNKEYVTSSCREYFAETYRDYVTRPSALKSARPESYSYIEDVLGML